jgi:hypothetical protein
MYSVQVQQLVTNDKALNKGHWIVFLQSQPTEFLWLAERTLESFKSVYGEGFKVTAITSVTVRLEGESFQRSIEDERKDY